MTYLFAADCSLTIAVVVPAVVHPILGMSLVHSNYHSRSLVVVAMLPNFDSRASCLVRPSAYSSAGHSFDHSDLASFLLFVLFCLVFGIRRKYREIYRN